MDAHTERMEWFEEAIFKQREEINDMMAEMFGLLKELTTSRIPEKVLVREEARHPITKNVNAISLVKIEKEKNTENNKAVDENFIELSELNALNPEEVVTFNEEKPRTLGWLLEEIHVTLGLYWRKIRDKTYDSYTNYLKKSTLRGERHRRITSNVVIVYQVTAVLGIIVIKYSAYGVVKLLVKSYEYRTSSFWHRCRGIVRFRPLFNLDENPIRTLGDYSKPIHEGYRNTIELPKGNNVVPLRSDTIRLVQSGCSFHELRSEDPNQHLKDFLKLLAIGLNVFQQDPSPHGRILLLVSLLNSFHREGLQNSEMTSLFSNNIKESLSMKHGLCEIDRGGGKLRDKNADESWEIIENLALYDHKGWNDLKDSFKPVKAIYMSQGTSKTLDRRLLELKDQINFLLKGS
ncbi:hypothetical protein Tco_0765673 [Tanacetum coccineum]